MQLSRIVRRPWLLVVSVLVLAVLVWQAAGDEAVPASSPLLATIEIGDVENAVTASGTLQPSTFVDVGAQVSGQLERLHVSVGDLVAAGDLVAEIDATVQRNRVEASRASLAALKAQLSAREAALDLAKANADRQSRLMQEDATTQADFDSAINTLASAQSSLVQLQSQIAQSEATLASEEAQLGYTKIYAPLGGTVASISIKEGQTLNAAQQTPIILRIADLTTMTAEAQVSEADVTKLKPGMDVYFTTLGSGDRRWHSTLRQILPTPIEGESTVVFYSALFDVDNRDNALYPGMTTQTFFITASAHDVLKVPLGALDFAGASPARGSAGRAAYVRVVGEDGDVERREIRIGVSSRVAAEVLSGLSKGDRVVAGVRQQSLAEPKRGRSRGIRIR